MIDSRSQEAQDGKRKTGREPGFTLHFEADLELPGGGFPHATAAFFAGLFVVADALHVLDETFFFAQLLEAAEHLFGGLIAAGFDLDHAIPCLLGPAGPGAESTIRPHRVGTGESGSITG